MSANTSPAPGSAKPTSACGRHEVGSSKKRAVHDVEHEAHHPDGDEDRQPHEHACDHVAAQGDPPAWRVASATRRQRRALRTGLRRFGFARAAARAGTRTLRR